MKSFHKIKILTTMAGIFMLAIAVIGSELPLWDTCPPEQFDSAVFLEGESATPGANTVVEQNAACYGNSAILCYVANPDEKPSMKWSFELQEAGDYLIALAATPVADNILHVSKIRYRIDDGAWVKLDTMAHGNAKWGIAESISWGTLGKVNFAQGTHTLEIEVAEARATGDGIYFFAVDAIALLAHPEQFEEQIEDLKSDVPGNCFLADEPLYFHPGSPVTDLQRKNWRYQVRNWRNCVVDSGVWRWDDAGLTLDMAKIPFGYYRLELRIAEENVADENQWAISLPFSRLQPLPEASNMEHAYAVDGAPSWMVAPDANDPIRPKNSHEVIAEIENRNHITMTRDRMSWEMKQDGTIDWSNNDYIADAAYAQGVKLCGLFQYAPEWIVNEQRVPVDLMKVYQFAAQATKHFGEKAGAWEFWNEPDGMSAPPWDFVAAQKAFYLGAKSVNPQQQILSGSSCLHPVPYYMDVAMENGLGEYCDVYNFHTYEAIEALPSSVQDENNLLQRYGVGGKPMWVTENGYSAIGTEQPHRRSKKYEHDFPTEIAQAEYAAKATMVMRTSGAARNFSFLFAPFNEGGANGLGGKIMGLIRWDFTAKAGVTALGTVIRQLSNAQYLGEYTLHPGTVGYLYRQMDETQTLVIWAAKKGQQVEVLLPIAKDLSAVDMMGMPLGVAPGKKLSLDQYPVYISGSLNLVPSKAFEPFAGADFAHPEWDRELVLALTLDPADFTVEKTKAFLAAPQGKAVLKVYNFSNEVRRGGIGVGADHFQVTGLPEEISLEAMSVKTFDIFIVPQSNCPGFARLELSGQFDRGTISPLVVPIVTGSLQGNGMREVKFHAESPENWQKNSAGTMTITHDPAEQAVKLETVFPANADLWTYPTYVLEAAESMDGAAGFSFEIKANKNVGFALIMLIAEATAERPEANCWIGYHPTTEWQTVSVFFESDLPRSVQAKEIRKINIGANPWFESDANSDYYFWIRNLTVYYPQP